MTTKICRKCEEEKELDDFYANDIYPDGYESTCKKCRNAHRSWRYRNPYTRQEQTVTESDENRLLRQWSRRS